jgi:L-lysine 6-transaminase
MHTGINARAVSPGEVHATIRSHMLADGFDVVLDLEKSRGTRLYDSRSGKWFLDLFTCFASSPIGFNHPRVREAAFVEKLGRVAVNKPSNSDLYTVEMAEFVDAFGRLAARKELPHLFFISGGTLAVENALKAAFDWKIRRNIAKGINDPSAPEGDLKGTKVVHFEQAFHGRSGYTLSLTNTFDPRKTMYFPKFDWPRVPNPKIRFPLEGDNLSDVIERERNAVAAVERSIDENPDDVAAIIIEPIQGEGGDNHFRPEFLRDLRRIADERDTMLIFDEIQTGMGLTGTMWAFEQLEVTPDIAAFGKKTQVCGIMVSERIMEAEDNVFVVSSRINSTWGGNLVDMVRCQRYLEIIHEEDLVGNAARMGARFLEGLRSAAEAAGETLANVRGRGLMCAFDLPTPELRKDFLTKLKGNGVMALPCGPVTVRFRPPLNISTEEVDEGLEAVAKTAREM